jgi:hypothetical protein
MTGPGSGSEPAFTCTGRGSHDSAVPSGLKYAMLRPGGQGGTVPAELRCPVCGLTKRVGYRARRRLADAGITEVDISILPF